MSIGFGQGDSEGGRGINLRLVMAVIVAIVGVIGYFAKTQVNPVTGEKQRVSLNAKQEMALGLQAAPQMMAQMGGEVDPDSPEARLVREVGEKLVQASRAARSPYVGNFNFHLLRDPKTINAFALPGGQVFITRGLLTRLPDEAALAGVLGHEIGHVIYRHGAEHMAKGELGQALVTAVAVGSDDPKGRAQMAAMMANQVIQLKYGRDDESESDRFGAEALVAAGYDPEAILDVMKVLIKASEGGRQPEILSSHPLPENRLRAMQAYLKDELPKVIAEHYPRGVPEPSRGRKFRVTPREE